MKNAVSVAILLYSFIHSLSDAQSPGEQYFKSVCASCHSVGKGKLVGPDLSGVYNIRSAEWLAGFIRSSQSMVKAGDPDAVAIFNEFNKIPMPDNQVTDDQIAGIIDYIRSIDKNSPGQQQKRQASDTTALADSSVTAPDTTGIAITPEMVSYGDSLFHGLTPFSGGATACISCHNIKDHSLFGGGKLAIDLNLSFTRLGQAGIQAILINPPFPAMKAAIPGKLTDEEIQSLTALLKTVNDRFPNSPFITRGGLPFFVISFVIAILLLVHIYLFYDNRRIPDSSPGANPGSNRV